MTRSQQVSQQFDKYKYYLNSVQSPETDAEFIDKTYKQLRKHAAVSMREDFCGTYSLTCEWVRLGPKKQGIGVDLDSEPLDYGTEHKSFQKLSGNQKQRVNILCDDVLNPKLPKVDVVNAMNFSYSIFKKREELKTYFKNVSRTLNDDGMFILDCFGGSECQEENEHETEHDDFSYYWDQDSFDPVTNEAQFYIHFKRKGEKKREKVFSYDWRLWTIPELRELMLEVGFKETVVYWEGTDKEGDGNGIFTRTEKGEECESWVAYVVGLK